MVALLALGLVLVNVLGRGTTHVSKAEALKIARPQIDFKPGGYQIRLLRRGIPPHAFWIVSFYIRKQGGGYRRGTLVLVDASSGKVAEVKRFA